MPIRTDDDVLGGEPRLAGTRIGVRHVAALVLDGSRSPAHVADQLDISLAEVYEALSYYYSNPTEITTFEQANEDARTALRDDALPPKDPA